ncbi:MAG: mandelate racemase/muconate lactonizing enzyme family protein [Pseudomonadota bacterium]
MKLKNLDIIVTAPPAPGWGGRYWILVKLTTDDGIIGWGECYAASVGPKAMRAVIEDVFDRHMAGENPEDIELMFRRVYSSGFTQRPDLTVIGAFSGLEIACWDILGKARDRPVHALLGGRMNERIRAYSYLYPLPHHSLEDFWTSPALAAEAASELVRQGYTAVKFDPAGPYTMRGGHMPAMSDISTSVAFCKAIRDAVGDKADLLFGTHGQFSTAGAIRLGQALEPYSPLWFEEPVPPDAIDEMAKVARAVRIPVATGERLTTKAEFGPVLRAGAATILQPALGRAGGIWEMKKVAAIAEVHNAQMAPHLYAGPIEWAANIQLAASIPNLLMAETIETPFHDALIGGTIRVEEGFITPPDAPGLGIDVDEDLARAHPYTGEGLHLEMRDAPCDYVNGNSFEGGAPVGAGLSLPSDAKA